MPEKFEMFGKYLLLEKIATGGMAEVYLARSTGASGITKFVAIKRILPQYSDNPEFIEMFKDEAKIAINLSHGNIVSIYEFGVEKGQFFLVMDYVEGRNLRQILNKMKKANSTLSIDQVVYIVKEVAAGLDHAHRCLDGTTGRPLNITHRDMSPQNIMLSFEGEVKIVDFGIAKAESQLEPTKAGTLKGKFGYMSPEQAEGLAVDLRTDIFSLGIVLWELLANDRLFIANNEVNTLRKIRECNVPSLRKINPSISPELEKIVNKALAKDRNLRYQTAAAFHKDLNRFLNRQYPDFSPQDFSIFSKTLFANEILDTRKRLIDYAKLPFDQMFKEQAAERLEQTQITATQTQSDVASFIGKSTTKMSPELSPESEEESIPSLKTSDKVKEAPPPPRPKVKKQAERAPDIELMVSRRRSSSDWDRGNLESVYKSHQTAVQNAVRSRTNPNILLRVVTNNFFLIIVVLSASIYYLSLERPDLFKEANNQRRQFVLALKQAFNPYPQKHVDIASKSNSETSAQEPGQKGFDNSAPTEEMHTVLIESRPAAAEIYIDGRNTGSLTPSTVGVPAKRPFSLGLRYDGYITYSQTMTSDQNGQKFQVTLRRARFGYVNINVAPSTAIVYVNGLKLQQTPPIKHFPVPADTPVVIRTEIPLTHASDEVKISVPQDMVKKVNLFPRSRGVSSER